MHAVIDKIEASEGPAVLVTIGTGAKIFSAGFDLKVVMQSAIISMDLIFSMQAVMARLMTINVPSMCIFNGHAVAGGLLLGLVHDFRVINAGNSSKVCFSEINAGLTLPPGYSAIIKSTLHPQVGREMAFGSYFSY